MGLLTGKRVFSIVALCMMVGLLLLPIVMALPSPATGEEAPAAEAAPEATEAPAEEAAAEEAPEAAEEATEEAAPEAEPEGDGSLRLGGEGGVVQPELLDRGAQLGVLFRRDGVDPGEDHRPHDLEPRERDGGKYTMPVDWGRVEQDDFWKHAHLDTIAGARCGVSWK